MRRWTALFVAGLFLLTLRTAIATDPPLATYIVTYDQVPTADQAAALSAVAASSHPFQRIPAAVAVINPADLKLLGSLPGVRGVYPNRSMKKLLRQSTRTVHADQVWAAGYTGAGIGVAIVDTGIDGTRPDLCAATQFCNGTPVRVVQNVKFVGLQDYGVDPIAALEDQINTDTSSGHGSHVAGIVGSAGVSSAYEAGKYRGVAWESRLIGLGTGEAASVDNVLAAIDWVLVHKDDPRYNIKVINNSWGPDTLQPYNPSDPVNLAINAAHDAGITVVFGAGNGGPSTDAMNAFSVNPNAISAAGGHKNGHIAFFSSRGVPGSPFWQPTITTPGYNIASVRASTGFYGDVADASGGPNPDLVTPPDDVYYASASGTSMAAPHVAGIVALMQQASFATRGVYLSPDAVKNILQNTAVSQNASRGPGGLPNYQHYSMGAGYADAYAAVLAASSGTQVQGYASHVVYDARGFTGTVNPQVTSFGADFVVLPGALSLDVMIDWGAVANAVDDLDIDLYDPSGALNHSTFLQCAPDAEPNGYSSFCTQLANERITAVAPVPGTWHAVIHALQTGPETVRGIWSAAYPDTVAAVHPAVASVTLAVSPASTSVAGQAVTVVATARDAAGNPVPNAAVTWSSAGVGSIPWSEAITHTTGAATATAVSNVGGTQTVTATAGGTSGSAAITWIGVPVPPGPPPPPSTPGKASGGGWIMNPGKQTFGFSAEYAAGATGPGGDLSFDDHAGNKVKGTAVTQLAITGNSATVKGTCTLNGQAGYRYTITAVDNGEPGRNDTFRLQLTSDTNPLYGYNTQGTLAGGNLQVTH